MKQKLSILLITSTLICALCAGCNNNSSQTKVNQNNEQQNTSSTSTSESESFVFRPIVDSPFYENAYSKEHMQTFRNMMNALMEYKTEFVIEEGVEWWEVEEFTPYMFPAYEYVVKQIDQNGLTGNIVY